MWTQVKRSVLGLLIFGCLVGLGVSRGWAEDAAKVPAKPAVPPQNVQDRIAKWKQLKEQNPEEFKRLIQERKEHLKSRLRELKEKDPKKYEEVKKRMYEHRVQYLRRLRQENPEKYREIVQRRWQKLEELKTKNPERFKEFMDKHPRIGQRWEERQHRIEMNPKGKGLLPGAGPKMGPKEKAVKGGNGLFGKGRR